MNDIEVWRKHPEFCSIEVSTLGKVRTVDRVVSCNGGTYVKSGRDLKQRDNYCGYLQVTFGVNGKHIRRYVHRLVAQTFIPNPSNLLEVNHKDCNRTNNNVDNLEWCDNSYNQRYREKHGEALGRPMFAISLETLEVLRFPSQIEAGRELGVNRQNINHVLKGERNQAGGYWFVNTDSNAIETTRTKFGDSVARKVEELMTNKEVLLS